MRIKSFISQHFVILLLLVPAVFIRVANLSTEGIFFGDSARDMLFAAQSVENRQIPLLGIPSSVPTLKQGPVAIWINMLIFLLFEYQTFFYHLIYSLFNIAALILIYEFSLIYLNKKTGIIAATLFAFSPLIITHARMPYHTTLIPLAYILFLFALMKIRTNQLSSILLSAFAFAFLFQFELANFPLILLIAYNFYRHQVQINPKIVGLALLGLVIGILPQLIFDLQHNFSQIGGFFLWMISRFVDSSDKLNLSFVFGRLLSLFGAFGEYFGKMTLVNYRFASLILISLLVLSFVSHRFELMKKKLPYSIELFWVSILIILAAYTLHSKPSEAYFPVLFVPISMVIAYYLAKVTAHSQLVIFLLGAWAIFNYYSVVSHNFLVSTNQPFSYGPSLSEMREIINVSENYTYAHYWLTTDDNGKYNSYFDNLRWLSREMKKRPEEPEGSMVFVENKNSDLNTYPSLIKIPLQTVDVYFIK